MFKKTYALLIVGMLLLLPMAAQATFIKPTETLQWDKTRTYNGYTAYTAVNGINYLIDMEGRVVKEWGKDTWNNSGYFYFLENGNIRRQVAGMLEADAAAGYGGGPGGGIEEHTWDGQVVWRWLPDGTDTNGNSIIDSNSTMRQHHDFRRIWNKALGKYTYLMLIWEKKKQSDAVKLGADPNGGGVPTAASVWSPDALIEIVPKYGQTERGMGPDVEVVWYWSFRDHFVTKTPGAGTSAVEFIDSYGRPNAPVTVVAPGKTLKDYPSKLDVNHMNYIPTNLRYGPIADMQHCNSFDYDDETGHIAINAKAVSEFFVIDHDGTFVPGAKGFAAAGAKARTSAGDFLYRWGNPAVYEAGIKPGYFYEGEQQMYGTHDIQYIKPNHWAPPKQAADTWPAPTASVALPGAGNFLLLDNGCYNPVNRVTKLVEINPRIGAGGAVTGSRYVNPPVAGYNRVGAATGPTGWRSRQVVWEFNGIEEEFYSLHISSLQRLPNGNTLSDAGRQGHFIEVTPNKQVVWEYRVPVTTNKGIVTLLQQGSDNTNNVFRAHRFGPDHPALAGKNLLPGKTITGRVPKVLGADDRLEPDPTGFGFGGAAGGAGGGAAGGTGGAGGGAGY
jgi:hypothetical protein